MFRDFSIQKILVPIDFSEAGNVAMNHAVDLAKKFQAEIALVHVLETGAYAGVFAPSKKTEYDEKEQAQLHLQQEAHNLKARSGVKVSHSIRSGRIYEEIVNACQEEGADMVVMGTHGVSGWAEFFVGSNAFKVVTQSPCPVLTIQEATKGLGFKNIIVPIDATNESRQKVRHAMALAKKYGSTLHIGMLITDDTPEIRFEFDKKLKQVTEVLDKEGVPYTHNTLSGSNLATMTMNYCESKGGDLIVIMTEQEYNLTGFLMGPFAQQVVNHSRVPVMCVSPEELTTTDVPFSL